MLEFLKGKKTYILQALLVVYAIAGVILGKMTLEEAMALLFSAATIASIRNAIQ